jgi:hypothetical protein
VKRLTSFSSAKGGAQANPFQTSTRRLADHKAVASLVPPPSQMLLQRRQLP